jgi:hypothetical protein
MFGALNLRVGRRPRPQAAATKMTDDRVRYLLADWEWFVPVADLEERFANRQRIRTGLGYGRNFHWRFEVIYAWTRSRETIEDDFATSDNIFNIRVKRVF